MKRFVLLAAFALISSVNVFSQWVQTNAVITQTSPTICLESNGNMLYAGTESEGAFVSKNEGDSWGSFTSGPIYGKITSFAFDGQRIFAGSMGDGVYASTDGGANWNLSNQGITSYQIQALASGNGAALATANGSIYQLGADGVTWDEVYQEFSSNYVWCMAFSGGSFLAGTNQGLLVSYDNGSNWKFLSEGKFVNKIISIAANGSFIAAATDSFGVYISKDDGLNWEISGADISKREITDIRISNNLIFVSTKWRGVYVTEDFGKSWKNINTGLPGPMIYCIATMNGKIFAATTLGRVYSAKISDFSANGFSDSEQELNSFSISPNPATDFIVISIPEGVSEEIRIFNIYGETVLNKPQFTIFNSQLKIDVSGLAPGVYFVRVGDKLLKFLKI